MIEDGVKCQFIGNWGNGGKHLERIYGKDTVGTRPNLGEKTREAHPKARTRVVRSVLGHPPQLKQHSTVHETGMLEDGARCWSRWEHFGSQ